MDGTRTAQTAFRFRPELLERLKNRARLEKKSLNNFVEEILEGNLNRDNREEVFLSEIKGMKKPAEISEEINSLRGYTVEFSDGELAADERLSYLLGK